ncbi:F-box/kelch-repeat protein At3g06240-like [Lotus japonicus]|uniref:F-box/kelch-repeat protein At3g06240-like n=1 Tax=Lotus japonicus TaxID=34305 RepID=UPI0025899C96|nr:F-box/kelch-repeat protein At3g06240-like [Lotus japonicus]
MKRRRKGSIGSSRATTRRGKRVAVAEKVDDDEPESQQLGVSFADLPTHVIGHILLRLPIKSIGICKCVCTSWKALISDPHFTKLHLQQAPAGFTIRANDRSRVSRILHLLEYEPEDFENVEDGQFCRCYSLIKPECNSHLKLEQKLKLPLRSGAKLDLDEAEKRGRKGHYIPSKPEDDRFFVVNSSNGLLCLSDHLGENFVVSNPVTGEFIRLPEATRIDATDYIQHRRSYVGFGFEPKTDEYKVVRIFHLGWGAKEVKSIEIYTLGTSTWRNVGGVNAADFVWLEFPTSVSGVLHWIGYYQTKLSILCFDFESESFQSFPSPPHLFKYSDKKNITMGELKGSLYICDSSSKDNYVRMWIMKKYGFGDSWTNVFSIDTMSIDGWPYGGLYWPVKHLENGAAVLMYHSSNCFIYYEPENSGLKVFKVRGTYSAFEAIHHIHYSAFGPIHHIPSLISLKDAVKGDNIEVMNVHSRCGKFKLREENEVLFLANVNAVVVNSNFISLDDEE